MVSERCRRGDTQGGLFQDDPELEFSIPLVGSAAATGFGDLSETHCFAAAAQSFEKTFGSCIMTPSISVHFLYHRPVDKLGSSECAEWFANQSCLFAAENMVDDRGEVHLHYQILFTRISSIIGVEVVALQNIPLYSQPNPPSSPYTPRTIANDANAVSNAWKRR